MTRARFDPRLIVKYKDAPPLLHFEFGDKVYRYARIGEIVVDPESKLTPREKEVGLNHDQIRAGLCYNPAMKP